MRMARKMTKRSLQSFLKREVEKKKIKVPVSETIHPYPSNGSANIANEYGDVTPRGDCSVDNLFGELLGAPSVGAPEIQTQLKKLLDQKICGNLRPKFTESSILQDLRGELETLILLQTAGTMGHRERTMLKRQKGALIEELRYMEPAERNAFESSLPLPQKFEELPY